MSFTIYNVVNLKISVIIFILFLFIGYCDKYFNYYVSQMNGHSSISMKPIVQQYRRFVEQNQDLGSSFTVYNNTVAQLNLVSGYEDLEFQQKWNKNTITQLFSLSHIVGIFSIALLVDSGALSYDEKLSKYIKTCHPSLANRTISDIMMHKAGVPYITKSMTVTDYRDDSDELFRLLFAQDALPRDHPTFHKYTQGLILDAIVRKVDTKHRSLPHFFIDEIAYRLKVDIVVGLPRTQLYRTARMYPPTIRQYLYALGRLDLSSIYRYFFPSEMKQKVESTFTDIENSITRDVDILEISLPSWNAFSNADSIATMFSALLFGSKDTKAVLSESTIEQLCSDSHGHYDEVIGSYVYFTKGGMMLFSGPKNSKLCGWRDVTGQFAFADMERNVTVAYVTNHLRALSLDRDFIATYLLSTLYDCL